MQVRSGWLNGFAAWLSGLSKGWRMSVAVVLSMLLWGAILLGVSAVLRG